MKDNFDKETEDLGWAKMQALLDKDMPKAGIIPPQYVDTYEPKKGAYSSKWLMVAVLLLGFGGCGLWTYQFLNKKVPMQQIIVSNITIDLQSKTPISSAQKPIATKKNEVQATSQNPKPITEKTDLTKRLNALNNRSEKTKTANRSNEKNNLKSQKIGNQLVANKDKINSVNDKLEINKLNTGETGLKSQSKSSKKTDLTNGLNDKELIVSVDKSNDIVAKEDDEIERLTFDNFDQLNNLLLSDSVLSQSTRTFPTFIRDKSLQISHQKWHLGMTSGFHTEGGKELAGFQIGMVSNRALNGHYSLSIGLNYRKNTVQSPVTSNFIADLSNKNASSISATVPNFSLSKVGVIELKNMQYAEMPLSINYLVKNRLSVSAGLKMSYLLSKKWSTIDTLNANTYVINYGSTTKTTGSVQSNDPRKAQQLELNALDVALIGSINYRILKQINVSLRYDHGLKNIISNSNTAAFNRYVGLNVEYYFK